MSEKSVRPPISPQSNRHELEDHINHAFETSDIDEICQAISTVTHLHDISDIAKKIWSWKRERLSVFCR
jgi:hypothetical protein